MTTSSYMQVLYFGNVVSQAGQNVVADVCMLLIKKDSASMTTYFAQHQLCLQLQLKSLDYACYDCIQGINHKEKIVSQGDAQSFTSDVYG